MEDFTACLNRRCGTSF